MTDLFSLDELKAKLEEVGARRKAFIRFECEGRDNGTPFDIEIENLLKAIFKAEEPQRTAATAAAEAAFAAEWTLEVFTERRALWAREAAKKAKAMLGIA